MKLEITEATFAPKNCIFPAVPGPQPDFVRVPSMNMVGFSVVQRELPDGYNPSFRLTLDYGLPIRQIDPVTHVRRKETPAFLTYTRVRLLTKEELP